MIPVGPRVDATPARRPIHGPIDGRYGRLRPLEPARDASRLHRLSHGPEREALWAYLFTGPYADEAVFRTHVETIASGTHDPIYWAVADADDNAVGWLSLMRIEPAHRVIEVGSILYTPALQRTRLATEAQYLLARHVFEALGYRRYEWKCNDLNAPSKRAAIRFGFAYEGLFRRHMIVKGLSRDTAWFAMIDEDWPRIRRAYETWLDPANFDDDGRQKVALSALTAAALSETARP